MARRQRRQLQQDRAEPAMAAPLAARLVVVAMEVVHLALRWEAVAAKLTPPTEAPDERSSACQDNIELGLKVIHRSVSITAGAYFSTRTPSAKCMLT